MVTAGRRPGGLEGTTSFPLSRNTAPGRPGSHLWTLHFPQAPQKPVWWRPGETLGDITWPVCGPDFSEITPGYTVTTRAPGGGEALRNSCLSSTDRAPSHPAGQAEVGCGRAGPRDWPSSEALFPPGSLSLSPAGPRGEGGSGQRSGAALGSQSTGVTRLGWSDGRGPRVT